MRAIVRVIDFISEYTGRIVSWVCVALILTLCFEVVARHVFDEPTIWAHSLAKMMGITIVTLGWAYVHKHHGHVRVDVIYTHLQSRGKQIVNVVGALIFLFPAIIVLIYAALQQLLFSLSIGEVFTESYWYPPAPPIRFILLLGLSLFALQALAQLVRDLYMLLKDKPL